jgi:tetratricopeptide (TPR) repeat protein
MAAVGPHVADLENALARAKQSIDLAAAGDKEHMFVLLNDPDDAPTDAQREAAAKAKKTLLSDPNPYLEIAFFLASYYDLQEKPEDALRVIDVALALPGSEANPHRFDLLSKRGAELGALKRWPEALAAYDAALKNEDLPPSVRAYMDRGRGMALFELGRKTEAKDAYLEALKLVGNDPQAKKELEYIEQNQDGGEKLPPSVKAFQVPADDKPSDTKPADQPAPQKP